MGRTRVDLRRLGGKHPRGARAGAALVERFDVTAVCTKLSGPSCLEISCVNLLPSGRGAGIAHTCASIGLLHALWRSKLSHQFGQAMLHSLSHFPCHIFIPLRTSKLFYRYNLCLPLHPVDDVCSLCVTLCQHLWFISFGLVYRWGACLLSSFSTKLSETNSSNVVATKTT